MGAHLHRDVVERVDTRALEADDDALHALLVERDGARLDRELAVRREAEHVGDLRVPRDGLGVLLLEHQRSRRQLVYGDGRVLVDDGELVAVHRQVQRAERRAPC